MAVRAATVQGIPVASGQIIGVTNGSDAPAGGVGEYLSVNIPNPGSNLPAAGTFVNVGSLVIPAGDWDINAVTNFSATANPTTVDFCSACLSIVSATLPGLPDISFVQMECGRLPIFGDIALPSGLKRFTTSGPITVFLIARTAYVGGQMVGFGFIRARRVR